MRALLPGVDPDESDLAPFIVLHHAVALLRLWPDLAPAVFCDMLNKLTCLTHFPLEPRKSFQMWLRKMSYDARISPGIWRRGAFFAG